MQKHPFTIAISGKGGTGKTTVSSLLIRSFIDSGEIPVLAVDADPNANLHEADGSYCSRDAGIHAGRSVYPSHPPGHEPP